MLSMPHEPESVARRVRLKSSGSAASMSVVFRSGQIVGNHPLSCRDTDDILPVPRHPSNWNGYCLV